MPSESPSSLIPFERIAADIYFIRGEKVMLDFDLAALYGVETKALNQAVNRNQDRFPPHFMFQLTKDELEEWRSQIVTSNPSARMGLRRPPHAFTEHGALMLSSVLRGANAARVGIAIVEAFVRLREMLATHEDVLRKIEEHDQKIASLYEHVERILKLPAPGKKPIGYIWPKNGDE